MAKQWTKKQIIILKKNYPKGSPKEMEKMLKRSYDTIQTKAKRMKIRRKVIILPFNSKNGMWKGDKVGYDALHNWIRRRKPKPKLCEQCHKRKSFDLSNISGKYQRDVNDFEWLCRKCHINNDGRLKKLFNAKNKSIKLLKNRKCVICKQKFKPNQHHQIYCSKKCKYERDSKKQKNNAISQGIDRCIQREEKQECLMCGKSLATEIMHNKIHIHLCSKCRLKRLNKIKKEL